MKVLITEVVMDKWKTTYNVNLNTESGVIWEDGRKEYEITDNILETIEDKEVFGWVDGVNRFGKPVKRTYMLIPN
jgi:hypothetical protein